jgi:phenylacetic acid degradation operon negative regulatory protein
MVISTTRPGGPGSLLSGVHTASARAVLLVGLGEFVWPSLDPIWSSTLVAFLAEFGFEPNAARKAIQRTAKSGLIAAKRDGRRVQWSITESGRRILDDGADRLFRKPGAEPQWDGEWLLLTLTVPESRRQLRHHLQKRLTWAGLGSPVPGQWISPHPERLPAVEGIVRDLGLEVHAQSFVGRHTGIGSEADLISEAWDLDALALSYRRFIDRFTDVGQLDDRGALVERIELVQEWRGFPALDPDLPAQHLPADWPRRDAAEVFWKSYGTLKDPSQRFWTSLEQLDERP